jgi:hypothetical protein
MVVPGGSSLASARISSSGWEGLFPVRAIREPYVARSPTTRCGVSRVARDSTEARNRASCAACVSVSKGPAKQLRIEPPDAGMAEMEAFRERDCSKWSAGMAHAEYGRSAMGGLDVCRGRYGDGAV